jgi:hypothetical protein
MSWHNVIQNDIAGHYRRFNADRREPTLRTDYVLPQAPQREDSREILTGSFTSFSNIRCLTWQPATW